MARQQRNVSDRWEQVGIELPTEADRLGPGNQDKESRSRSGPTVHAADVAIVVKAHAWLQSAGAVGERNKGKILFRNESILVNKALRQRWVSDPKRIIQIVVDALATIESDHDQLKAQARTTFSLLEKTGLMTSVGNRGGKSPTVPQRTGGILLDELLGNASTQFSFKDQNGAKDVFAGSGTGIESSESSKTV